MSAKDPTFPANESCISAVTTAGFHILSHGSCVEAPNTRTPEREGRWEIRKRQRKNSDTDSNCDRERECGVLVYQIEDTISRWETQDIKPIPYLLLMMRGHTFHSLRTDCVLPALPPLPVLVLLPSPSSSALPGLLNDACNWVGAEGRGLSWFNNDLPLHWVRQFLKVWHARTGKQNTHTRIYACTAQRLNVQRKEKETLRFGGV